VIWDSGLPSVWARIFDKEVQTFLDSGASVSCIHPGILEGVPGDKYEQRRHSVDFKGADSRVLNCKGKILTTIKLGEKTFQHYFFIIDNLPVDYLLGNDFLKGRRTCLDQNTHVLRFPDNYCVPLITRRPFDTQPVRTSRKRWLPAQHAVTVCIKADGLDGPGEFVFEPDQNALQSILSVRTVVTGRTKWIWLLNTSRQAIRLPEGQVIGHIEELKIADVEKTIKELPPEEKPPTEEEINQILGEISLNKKLSEDQKARFLDLIRKNIHVFRLNFNKPTHTTVTEHSIETTTNNPIRQYPYRVTMMEQAIIRKEIAKMLGMGIIRPSKSPWASPIVLVTKKDGSIRFCIDYRKLNAVIVNDAYPIPNIDDNINYLVGKKFYSTCDAISGFWQIPMREEDIPKTAFVSADGLYEFLVMPFGLRTNSQVYQRLMDNVLEGIRYQFALDYIDDLMVYSDSFEDHLSHMQKVFDRLTVANIKLKASKCCFAQNEVVYLGFNISEAGVAPDPAKILAIVKFELPKNVTDLRSFLGLCNYYRRFIPQYAHLAKPLYDLVGKDSPWNMDYKAVKVFQELKTLLTKSPILRLPDFSKKFILQTDASNHAMGAVLSQIFDGEEHPVLYLSKTLSKSQRNYSTTQKEALAVVWAIKTLRHYLYGREFTVITDHKPLIQFMEFKRAEGMLARWALALQTYVFDIQWRPGRLQGNADGLSRPAHTDNISDSETAKPFVDEDPLDLFLITTDGNMERAQKLDPYLTFHFKHVTSPDSRFFLNEHGVLYRKVYSRTNKNNPQPKTVIRSQLVLPRSQITEALQMAHDCALTGGHLALKKTLFKIRARFWWPGMAAFVSEWIRTCPNCLARKPNHVTVHRDMFSIPVSEPFEIMGMDILGPLPTTQHGNRYVLVCTDHFTKWVEAFAIPEFNGSIIGQLLVNNILCRFGTPKHILSDRGSYFTGRIVKNLLEYMKIKQLTTSAYHPRTDGTTERQNKTMADMISMYVSKGFDDWDQTLPHVTMAYNSSQHASTGYTPYHLLFGREARFPVDVVLNPNVNPQKPKEDFVKELAERLSIAHETAKLAIERAQARQTEDYARRHPTGRVEFAVGDHVMVFNEVPDAKFQHRWTGPYVVLERRGPVMYRLQSIDQDDIHFMANVETMKPYYSRDLYDALLKKPSRNASEPKDVSTDVYPTEAVLKTRQPAANDIGLNTMVGSLDRPCDPDGCLVGKNDQVSDLNGLPVVVERAHNGDDSLDIWGLRNDGGTTDLVLKASLLPNTRDFGSNHVASALEGGHASEVGGNTSQSELGTASKFESAETMGSRIMKWDRTGVTETARDSKVDSPRESHTSDSVSQGDDLGDSAKAYGFKEGSVKEIHLQPNYFDDEAYFPDDETNSRIVGSKRKSFKEVTKEIFSSAKEREKKRWSHLFIPDVDPNWHLKEFLEEEFRGHGRTSHRWLRATFQEAPEKPIWLPEAQACQLHRWSYASADWSKKIGSIGKRPRKLLKEALLVWRGRNVVPKVLN
jgi:hypothetical protein